MNKIGFKILNNVMYVDVIDKTEKENLNNTNVINTKNIYFSEKYINENTQLVSSFLNVIIIRNKINTINVKNNDVLIPTLKIINSLTEINTLICSDDKIINYDEFLYLLDAKNLTNLEIYDIPPFLLERLDMNKGLFIKVRSEILFISNFMNYNNINTYSDIFYKKEINIKEFYENDYEDFNSFMEINNYLKIINLHYYSKKQFDYIFNLINKHNLKNIKICLIEKDIKLDDAIEYITNYKKNNEEFILKNNINFKIIYSDEYKKNNIFKQINLNFLKISLIFAIFFTFIMIGINMYRNYKDTKNYENIENDLAKLLLNINSNNNETDQDIIFIEPNEEDKFNLTSTTTTTTTIYDIKYDKVFEKLLEINKDTVGWLTVNNTNIDYPVVKYSNNDYYLNKDYYQNKNRHGWIFMDYRNDYKDLSDNTIIYGHNLANQKMFGTLRYATNPTWYKKTKNQIITFNTLNENMKWQIFSIYKLPVTDDYLIANFSTNEEKINFLQMITNRSIYNFNQTFDEETKILTLSTCSNGSKERLVVHAKLIK